MPLLNPVAEWAALFLLPLLQLLLFRTYRSLRRASPLLALVESQTETQSMLHGQVNRDRECLYAFFLIPSQPSLPYIYRILFILRQDLTVQP